MLVKYVLFRSYKRRKAFSVLNKQAKKIKKGRVFFNILVFNTNTFYKYKTSIKFKTSVVLGGITEGLLDYKIPLG